MINSKQKGARGERLFRDVLISHGIHARRGCQFSGDPEAPDVISPGLPIRWEVKLGNSHNLTEAFRQADGERGNKIPVVASKRDRGEWMVYLYASDFLDFAKVYIEAVKYLKNKNENNNSE